MARKFKTTRIHVSDSWWETQTLEQKIAHRENYEKIRKENFTRRFPYPNMVDASNSKITQLTGNQIQCIWRFCADEEWFEARKRHIEYLKTKSS